MTRVLDWFTRARAARRNAPEIAAADESTGTTSTRDERAAEEIAGERGIPSVNRVRSVQSRVSSLLAIGLMSVLGLGLLTWYYAGMAARQSRARESAQQLSKHRAQGEMPLPPLGRIEPPAVAPVEPSTMEQVLGPPPPLPEGGVTGAYTAPVYAPAAYATQKTPEQLALERRLGGAVLATPTSGSSSAAALNAAAPATMEPEAPPSAAMMSDDGASDGRAAAMSDPRSLSALLRPSVTPAVQARVLPTQRWLLPKGAFIDCTLETALDSTLPGMTTCITATDTFSVDGRIVLLERGTKLVGETRGEVRQGAARMFVLWTEARTPTGVVVPLASPGTDELGRAGLAGYVNRHFWQRFGAAILISVIDGAIQAAVQSSRDGDTTVIYSSQGSQDIITEVLKSTVNIPPTVVKHQGDRIQVLVARDLDFRSVYELRPVARQ